MLAILLAATLSTTSHSTFFTLPEWMPETVNYVDTPGSHDWFVDSGSNIVETTVASLVPTGSWHILAYRLPETPLNDWYEIPYAPGPTFDPLSSTWCVTNSVEEEGSIVEPEHIYGSSVSTNLSGWTSIFDYGDPVGVATNRYKAWRAAEFQTNVIRTAIMRGVCPVSRISTDELAALNAAFEGYYERGFFIGEGFSPTGANLRAWQHSNPAAFAYAPTNRIINTRRFVEAQNLDSLAAALTNTVGFIADLSASAYSPDRSKTRLFTSLDSSGWSLPFPEFDWTDNPIAAADWRNVLRSFSLVDCSPYFTDAGLLDESIAYDCFRDFNDASFRTALDRDIKYQDGVNGGNSLALSNLVISAYEVVDENGCATSDMITNATRRLYPHQLAAADQIIGLVDRSFSSAPDRVSIAKIDRHWGYSCSYTNTATVHVSGEAGRYTVDWSSFEPNFVPGDVAYNAYSNTNAAEKIAVRFGGIASNGVAQVVAGPATFVCGRMTRDRMLAANKTRCFRITSRVPDFFEGYHVTLVFPGGGSGNPLHMAGHFTLAGVEYNVSTTSDDGGEAIWWQTGLFDEDVHVPITIKCGRSTHLTTPYLDSSVYPDLLGANGYATSPGRLGLATHRVRSACLSYVGNVFAGAFSSDQNYDDPVSFSTPGLAYDTASRVHSASSSLFETHAERAVAITSGRVEMEREALRLLGLENMTDPSSLLYFDPALLEGVRLGSFSGEASENFVIDGEIRYTNMLIVREGRDFYIVPEPTTEVYLDGEIFDEVLTTGGANCIYSVLDDSDLIDMGGYMFPSAADCLGHVVTDVIWNWQTLKGDNQ